MALKIYFASPLFTSYERDWINETVAIMRSKGLDVFSPIEKPFQPEEHPEITAQKLCFDLDFGGLGEANALFVNLNGYEVDDGTATEIGIFYALMKNNPARKGIVAYLDDWRQQENGDGKGLNLFIRGCIEDAGFISSSMDDIITQLLSWQEEMEAA